MALSCLLYKEWISAWNKDALKFYADKEFRKDYTENEMDSKMNLFMKNVLPQVKAALREISSQTKADKLRILSLGCGPGSDLLGILRAVDSVLRGGDVVSGLRWEAGELRCSCLGVDAFPWTRDAFQQKIVNKEIRGMLGKIRYGFINNDMDSVVPEFLQSKYEFDFICLSFADAGRNVELIGTALPQLLSEYGRIFVLDNDIPPVRRLTDYGFTCSFAGYGCMHSRGRGSELIASASYRAPLDSPIELYRHQQQMLLDEQQKEQPEHL